MIKLFILSILLIFGACASETAKMAHQIHNNSNNEFNEKNTELCKTMINKSVLLFRDSLTPLSVDTKVEILQKYLFCKGKRIFHVWAGSFGIKKNDEGIMFAKLWLDISRKRINRSQFSEKEQERYF